MNQVNTLSLPILAIKERLKEIYKQYIQLKKNAESLRESWLMDLVAVKAKHNNID